MCALPPPLFAHSLSSHKHKSFSCSYFSYCEIHRVGKTSLMTRYSQKRFSNAYRVRSEGGEGELGTR